MSDDPLSGDFSEMMKLTMEGRLALAMGNVKEALTMLRRKHQLVIESFGEDSVFAATSAVDLGEALLGVGNYQEARELLDWGVARYQAVGVSDGRVDRARGAAAQAAYRGADYAIAEARYLALIRDIRARGQESETPLAAELDHLAQVYIRQHQYEKAEDLLTEALSIWQQQPDAGGDMAVCLGMLAMTYFQRQRFREAEQCNRRALALFREGQSEDSLQYAQCADHLAMTLALRGRHERKRELTQEAVLLGTQALKIFMEQLPPSHPSVHGSRQNLAKYRHEAASIGYLYSGSSPNDDSDEDSDDSSSDVAEEVAALLQEPDHPHSIVRLIHSAQEASTARDFSASDSLLARALTLAESKYEPMSPIVISVHEAEIEILRRRCSMLLGEPSGTLSPSGMCQ